MNTHERSVPMRISAMVRAAVLAAAMGMGAVAAESPPVMKAVRIHSFGGPDVMRVEEAPVPVPGAGEVLVRVHAAGVNPVDWKIRDGMLREISPALPRTLGQDVSGVVESVGEGVGAFKPGDEVFAYLSLRRGGGYAEYAIAETGELAKKPASIDHEHAAAVPLAALTAWQALVDQAHLDAGQTVLVHAGAGGVGHFAVQIAKAKGATVIATASAANHGFLKEIGADVTIDYRTQKFEEVAKDVDVVLDPIGGETQERSLGVLKKGGMLVSIVQPPSAEKLTEHEVRGGVMLVTPEGAQLARIAAMIDAGTITPHVSAVFDLAEAAKALEMSQAGHTRGKIVLRVNR
jgi:NADPH:quinone reductase-like Zn-dependent oxidoreductase